MSNLVILFTTPFLLVALSDSKHGSSCHPISFWLHPLCSISYIIGPLLSIANYHHCKLKPQVLVPELFLVFFFFFDAFNFFFSNSTYTLQSNESSNPTFISQVQKVNLIILLSSWHIIISHLYRTPLPTNDSFLPHSFLTPIPLSIKLFLLMFLMNILQFLCILTFTLFARF